MSGKSPNKRLHNPHVLLDESELAKRACLEQPGFLDASRLQEPAWLNPISSSNPSQRNSFSPFELSDAGSSRLSPLGDQPSGNEDTAVLSDNESDQCCFGELLIDFSSPATFSEDLPHVPIELRFSGHVISLHVDGSGKYIGRIESNAIVDLVQDYQVTLAATLECPPVKKKKSADSFQTPKTLHIVIYGLRKDMNDIGDFLEDSELFLQHPTEYDTRLEYLNPQYLLRPGSTIPRADGATFQALANQHSSNQVMEEKAKSEVHQVFDSASGPSTFTQVQPSPRLKTSLQEHQKKALAMMVEMDRGLLDNTTFPSLWDTVTASNDSVEYRHAITGRNEVKPAPLCGGILADDMGLGKTLSTLALISWFLDVMDNASVPATCRATLIVAPNSTIPAWQEQVARHIVPEQIRVVLFHGPMRDQLAKSLMESDVVLTTYGTLQSEWRLKKEASPLFTHTWARVVLDEAHHIRERSTQTFRAVTALRTSRRWCLTGTPIQNRLDDYGALLTFIGVPPFINKSAFDFWIMKPVVQGTAEGLRRLKVLVNATCLRRTKDSVSETLSLPDRKIREYAVQLDPEDRELYSFFKKNASHLIANRGFGASNTATKTGNILPIINTLRLICNHGQRLLPSFALDAWTNRQNPSSDSNFTTSKFGLCISCGVEALPNEMQSEFACSHFLCSKCADSDERYQLSLDNVLCPSCTKYGDSVVTDAAAEEGDYRPSAKIRALIQSLRVEQQGNPPTLGNKPVKSVIFTFWRKMLKLLEFSLQSEGFKFARIDGQKSLLERTSALQSFRDDDSCTVMIATIGSIGEGVDLTTANYIHLVEPHWNPMLEEQALDRVHRMGQTRDVVATRYITNDSIEMLVKEIKERKLDLINSSLGHLTGLVGTQN
ncbi:SNF2 family domain-containing protein [Fusarium phyllophilum]|uniref:SNF2 family domain-containing protein n=1 Tax=Fusarium phyllophilum TaxID=47803 RepID=A0A8H5I9U2_9HYPO|nr:SNF2 family domain-containing protein [Fusarium phyllophilum]